MATDEAMDSRAPGPLRADRRGWVEMRVPISRRRFLGRCGALGAVAVAAQIPGVSFARAAAKDPPIDEAAAALRLLARDTIAGLVAFVVPGPDRYSRAQRVTHPQPGGVAARAPEGITEALDHFVSLPDTFAQAMAAAFATGTSEAKMPALDPLLAHTEQRAATLDRALQTLTANDDTIPLSLLTALMLNFVATSVSPRSVSGPIPSAPFSNLRFAEKAEVFRRIEEDNAELVALIDGDGSEPTKASLSGVIRLVGGALTAFATLYSYSEWNVFDRERGVASRRPLGWDLTRYAPGRTGPSDGWDDFMGYYGGRRRARPTRRTGGTLADA